MGKTSIRLPASLGSRCCTINKAVQIEQSTQTLTIRQYCLNNLFKQPTRTFSTIIIRLFHYLFITATIKELNWIKSVDVEYNLKCWNTSQKGKEAAEEQTGDLLRQVSDAKSAVDRKNEQNRRLTEELDELKQVEELVGTVYDHFPLNRCDMRQWM